MKRVNTYFKVYTVAKNNNRPGKPVTTDAMWITATKDNRITTSYRADIEGLPFTYERRPTITIQALFEPAIEGEICHKKREPCAEPLYKLVPGMLASSQREGASVLL